VRTKQADLTLHTYATYISKCACVRRYACRIPASRTRTFKQGTKTRRKEKQQVLHNADLIARHYVPASQPPHNHTFAQDNNMHGNQHNCVSSAQMLREALCGDIYHSGLYRMVTPEKSLAPRLRVRPEKVGMGTHACAAVAVMASTITCLRILPRNLLRRENATQDSFRRGHEERESRPFILFLFLS
jgi:hypothetical protein